MRRACEGSRKVELFVLKMETKRGSTYSLSICFRRCAKPVRIQTCSSYGNRCGCFCGRREREEPYLQEMSFWKAGEGNRTCSVCGKILEGENNRRTTLVVMACFFERTAFACDRSEYTENHIRVEFSEKDAHITVEPWGTAGQQIYSSNVL
jgi:hypothetical protein